MDNWYFRLQFVKHVRKWLAGRTGTWQSFFFYPDSVGCPVDVESGKRVKVTIEIEDDPDFGFKTTGVRGLGRPEEAADDAQR